MKTTTKNSAFFHTLVVVGGSIVGCGGQAEDASERSGDGDGDGASSGGQSGDGDGDVGAGTGGMISTGTGGRSGIGGGIIIIATGGASTGLGGAYMGGAHGLGCSPEQWDCGSYPSCYWEEDDLAGNCTCDESKPTGQSDCPQGTSLTCRLGYELDADLSGDHPLPFDCECVPIAETCREQCSPVVQYPSECLEPGMLEDFQGYLCGCELPVLR